jgi:phage shock protein E
MTATFSLLLLAILVILYLLIQRSSLDAAHSVSDYLRRGALLIDVRSASEFNSGHLPSAINLPLGQLDALLPRHARSKDQMLLLHCKSGMRSGFAVKRLKRQGYCNTLNLGSYGRAARMVRLVHETPSASSAVL